MIEIDNSLVADEFTMPTTHKNEDHILSINNGKNLLVTIPNKLNDFDYIVAKLLSTNETEKTLKSAI